MTGQCVDKKLYVYMKNKNSNKYLWIYPAVYFMLWIFLFEFILPVNNILPKPSIVLESAGALWNDYNFLFNLLSTISSVYISLFAAFFLIRFFLPAIGRNNQIFHFILSLEWFSHYVPGLVLGLFLIYWFPDSEFIEFIFAFLTAFLSLVIKINQSLKNVPDEYISSIRSLGAEDTFVTKNVVWKLIQPVLFKHLFQLHLYLWLILIAFEFIKGGLGIGVIFKEALFYRDLSTIFLSAFLSGIIIYLGTLLIRFLQKKFFNWRLS